ncbi:MAG: site-specific integrase [Nitrospirales bacterium]|nr:site-specific integrase [Nitrospirales bacterium]
MYLQLERGVSPETRRSYQSDLKQFMAHIRHTLSGSDLSEPGTIDSLHIRSYLKSLSDQGLKKTSLAKTCHLRKLFFVF